MRRKSTVLVAALSGLAVFGTGCVGTWQQASFERDVEVVLLVPAGSGVSATTKNGSISMTEAARDDVLVRAHIKAISQERADAVQIMGAGQPGWLEISVVWPEGRHVNEGVSFAIDAPGGRPVRADTGNGSISIAGFAGGVDADTSNGPIHVTDHDGPIDVETSNGRITILGATESVAADTSNGGVRVELTDDAAGPVRIDTSNGAVTLVVGPGFAGRIQADTSNGPVRIDGAAAVRSISGSRTHKRVQIGEGGEASHIDTSNGSIEIEVRG